jgi:uncharacterized protein (TIGR02266 family)
MSQDTRKDPRAKIVSLNVRYKSATVDEFIENHSHDVSRGGLFIKTSTPFAQGTLLKFEIRLSSDQPVIAGVGRVVWKREPGQAASDRPAGMGVKFIKIDDRSRGTIEKLVTTKADAGAAFAKMDEEVTKVVSPSGPPRVDVPSVKPTVAGMPVQNTHTTEIGLAAAPPRPEPIAAAPVVMAGAAGAVVETVPRSTPPRPTRDVLQTPMVQPVVHAPAASPASSGESSFFPQTGGEQDMPPPQERTMMRQAAELLEEALKASGGSMDEVGQNPLFAGLTPQAPEVVNPTAATVQMPSLNHTLESAGGGLQPADPARDEQVATIGGFPTSSPSHSPAVVTPAAAASAAAEASESAPRRRSSNPPPSRASISSRPVRATDLMTESQSKSGGGGLLWAGLAVVAIGGGLAYAYQAGMLTEADKGATRPPTTASATMTQTAPPATTAATAAPAPTETTAPTATTSAGPAASISAAPTPTPTPAPTPEPIAAKTPGDTKPVEAKPTPAPAPAPVAKKPVPAPKPAAEETKPAETTPAAAEKPAAEAKPEGEIPAPKKPAPKPAAKKPKDDSDNPY